MKLTDYFKALNEGKQMELVGNIGYVIFPNCIRRCLRVSSEELMVFAEICSLYNETKKYAYPTQQTLAMSIGVTASTVCRILLHLEEKEFITSTGKQGVAKKYRPSFNLHTNPYVVLSEWFHIGTKAIHRNLIEGGAKSWGDKMLKFVNVKQSDEFSGCDPYGQMLLKMSKTAPPYENLKEEFFSTLLQHFYKQTGINVNIDWSIVFTENKCREKKLAGKEKFGSRKRSSLAITQDTNEVDYDAVINK